MGYIIISLSFAFLPGSVNRVYAQDDDIDNKYPLLLEDIWIRDPNIIYFNNTYYMTGTTAEDGFLGYSSPDLVHWKDEGYIYRKNDSNYWAQKLFWAPEIKYINNKFYMFFTADSDDHHRGTGVAVSDSPTGPFYDLMPDPLTPPEYDCLDGHLFIHPNGTYYFFYVYEWLNEGDGAMWLQEMSNDLKHLIGTPIKLFEGPDAPWGNTVVDGPCMFYINNTYFLFWSSFNSMNGGKYCVGYASAKDIKGPYTIERYPIFDDDGGHPTIFYERGDPNASLLITFHYPNAGPEHAVIYHLVWDQEADNWKIPEATVNSYNCGRINPYIVVLAGVLFAAGSIMVIKKLRDTKRS